MNSNFSKPKFSSIPKHDGVRASYSEYALTEGQWEQDMLFVRNSRRKWNYQLWRQDQMPSLPLFKRHFNVSLSPPKTSSQGKGTLWDRGNLSPSITWSGRKTAGFCPSICLILPFLIVTVVHHLTSLPSPCWVGAEVGTSYRIQRQACSGRNLLWVGGAIHSPLLVFCNLR